MTDKTFWDILITGGGCIVLPLALVLMHWPGLGLGVLVVSFIVAVNRPD